LRQTNHAPTKLVAYCRVSSAAQKADLANQRKVLEEFVVAKGLAGVEFIEEVGGGLNFKRKRFYGRDRATRSQDADPRPPGPPHPLSGSNITPKSMAAKCWYSTRNGCLPNRRWCKT